MKPAPITLALGTSAANAPDVVALLKSLRDVTPGARRELLADLVARGHLSASDAGDVAAKAGGRL